jgi:putative acyl-CoA dehydrogenase
MATDVDIARGRATHEVTNQPPPLVGYNLFSTDQALIEALHREGGGWAEDQARTFGQTMGTEEVIQLGFAANENPPVLRTHDRYGNRRDVVEFHPAWHELLRIAMSHGLHSSPWRDPREGAHVARAAMLFMATQIEAGQSCPITMTYGVIPSLRKEPDIAREWEPKIHATKYDPRYLPVGEKSSALLGMAMTEKQGGSDVRANATRATPIGRGGSGAEYTITGHKWFCSAPMCDAFLVLAYAPGGLSCFFLPRWTPDGKPNRIFLQRLKDKLGNRSNASSEIEIDGAWARMVGEEGRGVPTIIEMANHTRLDCVIGSAGMMRQAVAQAIHHARHRSAFGKALIDQPLMRNVLGDLAIESEAATILTMRLARGYDRQEDKDFENPFRRIATAVAKFWITKRATAQVFEALECLGGNGYVEESILPRMYRECPLNSIWEGSGNVICLDVLRALAKEPKTRGAFLTEVRLGVGFDRRLDAAIHALEADLADPSDAEPRARRLVEKMAVTLQASLLVRHGNRTMADAFCATRLDGDWGRTFGTLPASTDLAAILERAQV